MLMSPFIFSAFNKNCILLKKLSNIYAFISSKTESVVRTLTVDPGQYSVRLYCNSPDNLKTNVKTTKDLFLV